MSIVYNGQKGKICKDIFKKVIPMLCEYDKDVVYLDADLMECLGTSKWASTHKDKAFNCGIAEANMIGIAAGMSSVGCKPIVHSFSPFVSRRVFDQIFLSVAYADNSITVIGSDPGIIASFNGGTHMSFEDISLYRTIPGSIIFDITDYVMLDCAIKMSINLHGIKYIRSMRKDNIQIYGEDTKFEIGKAKIVVENGYDLLIVASGIMVSKAIEAANILKKEKINATVIDPVTIKPFDDETLIKYAKKCGSIITCENHNRIGGLYSTVCEILSYKYPTKVKWVAIDDEFGSVGSQNFLENKFKLTADEIIKNAKELVNNK